MKLLVTGSTGFVARALLENLSRDSRFSAIAAFRGDLFEKSGNTSYIQVGNLDSQTNWKELLKGVITVIHTAARVHIMNDSAEDSLIEFRRVNVAGTLNLANQAVQEGVRRFIFISSIKVNGEITPLGKPFTPDDPPAVVQDPYGISKCEAEVALNRLADETDMEVVVIRPPLVYGPNVKGNFASMIRILEKGIPLPLGSIHNKRSLVALDNLVDLIVTCIDHPDAANQTFLAGDDEDLSTTELVQRLGSVLGKPARLFPLPASLLMLAATLIGKRVVAQRLCGSLQVDISKTRKVLGWEPPISVDEGLRRAVEGFKT